MCELHNDECRYDKPPPMSQLVAMARRLQDAEAALAEMRSDGDRPISEIAAIPHMDQTEQTSPPNPVGERHRGPLDHVLNSRVVTTNGNEQPSPTGRTWEEHASVLSQSVPPAQRDATARELTVDEHGSVRYYGPTSAVHEPSPVMPEAESPHDVSHRINVRSSLALHARESSIWEEFAIGNASVQTGVPRQVIAKLLHIHWAWVGPMFLWIHRSAFIRTQSHLTPMFCGAICDS